MVLSKTTPAPGEHVGVSLSGLTSPSKVMLTTVDADGTESGWYPDTHPSNINRPAPGGTMSVGILAPPLGGAAKVRAYQDAKVVVEASMKVTKPAVVPAVVPAVGFPAPLPLVLG